MPIEIVYFILILVLSLFVWWLTKKTTLTEACPKCKSALHVKRINRGPLSKYFLFFMFAKKLRCSKCWKEFYQLFALYKPDPNTNPNANTNANTNASV